MDGTADVAVAGRIVFMRKMGKLSFVRLRDIESELLLLFATTFRNAIYKCILCDCNVILYNLFCEF